MADHPLQMGLHGSRNSSVGALDVISVSDVASVFGVAVGLLGDIFVCGIAGAYAPTGLDVARWW